MTDITELAQKRNAAISRLSRAFEPGRSSQSELEALSYTVDVMNELVEALEKAQQRISELDIKNCELDSLTQRWAVERAENAGRIAELESQLKSAENNDIDARCHIAELESRTVTPVNYSENTDADHCRKWAWQQVKGEVSTEGWTSGDNATYFGFFCWGWDMRRQYNEQRPINAKLPKTMYTEFDDDDYCREVAVLDKQQVIDCLTAAGIKWEAE